MAPDATLAHQPMLKQRKGHVFVEVNYPHLIGISGYERSRCGELPGISGELAAPSNVDLAPFVPN
jgi:hypothetical protein